MIATLSNDELKIWRCQQDSVEKMTSPNDVNGKLLNLSWNHTNQVIAVSNTLGEIQLYHSQTGDLLSNIPFDTNNDGGINKGPSHNIAFSDNSRYIAQSMNSSVLMWDLKKRALKNNFVCSSNVTSLTYLPDSKLASGDTTGTLYIWDLKSNISIGRIIPKDMETVPIPSITCLKSSTSKIASSLSNGHLNIYDMNTLTLIRQQSIHTQSVRSIAFSPKNSRLIASCGSDGRLSLTDINSKSSEPTATIIIGGIILFILLCIY